MERYVAYSHPSTPLVKQMLLMSRVSRDRLDASECDRRNVAPKASEQSQPGSETHRAPSEKLADILIGRQNRVLV